MYPFLKQVLPYDKRGEGAPTDMQGNTLFLAFSPQKNPGAALGWF